MNEAILKARSEILYGDNLRDGESVIVGNAYHEDGLLLCDVTIINREDTYLVTFFWDNKKKRADRYSGGTRVGNRLFDIARRKAEAEFRDYLRMEPVDEDWVGNAGEVTENSEDGVRILRCSVPVHVNGKDFELEFEWRSDTKRIERIDESGGFPKAIYDTAFSRAKRAIKKVI